MYDLRCFIYFLTVLKFIFLHNCFFRNTDAARTSLPLVSTILKYGLSFQSHALLSPVFIKKHYFSEIIEGDILMSPTLMELTSVEHRTKREITTKMVQRWTNNIVPFVINSTLGKNRSTSCYAFHFSRYKVE